jgi:hypothetical protein
MSVMPKMFTIWLFMGKILLMSGLSSIPKEDKIQ